MKLEKRFDCQFIEDSYLRLEDGSLFSHSPKFFFVCVDVSSELDSMKDKFRLKKTFLFFCFDLEQAEA